ncbi:MAG: sigma 54-interacting transcriptional regulator [Desulfamplus sp.]|nr:sigma 54-interacting transcriptional regulator [Desulfamplus sp.]
MMSSFETLTPMDSLQKTAMIMRRSKLDILPVTDADGQLIGIMTKANLYDAVAAGMLPDRSIEGLFVIKNLVTLQDDTSYEEAAEIVRKSRAGSAVVIDKRGKVSGIFTKAGWIMAMFNKEEELNSQLRAILNTMHNGLVVVDSNGLIINLNHAAEKILCTTSSRSIGKSADSLLQGLKIDDVLVKGEVSIGIKHRIEDLSLLCNITPLISEGQIISAVIVFQDLTDLNRIASELETVTELYETLRSVMEIAYDGIILVNEKGIISTVNRAAADFFRKEPDSMVGKPVDEVVENSRLKDVLRTGVADINQLQFIGGVPYVASGLPIMREGRVIGAVGKIMFRHLEEVQDLARKLVNLDQQLAYYKKKLRDSPDDRVGFGRIVTADPVFKKIKEKAEIVARGTSNILITGESGTGKELIVQAIHETGFCSNGPLIKINCAAIPDHLLESEFFGYAPGAFTGAHKNGKVGKLAMADGGTLFLDEIGDMSLNLQSKLLRVLQDKCFEPVGSNRTVQVSIRLIAATNHDLTKLIREGRFRSDLYYRLNVIHFHLPPLRERPNDIKLLLNFFLEKYNRIFGTSILDISKNAQQVLLDYHWLGNVRELENVVERIVNFVRGSKIEIDDLPLYLREKDQSISNASSRSPLRQLFQTSREDHEKEMILAALNKAGGNKAKAARILGISRSWLYEKMTRAGLNTI